MAALTKKREKERAAWWMFKRWEMLNNIWLVNISTGLFEFGGTSVGVKLERGGGQSLWGDGQSQGQGECATHKGERETQELTKYRGMNGSQWNDGGAWERWVVQDFQTRGSDPVKQVISGRVRGNESVPDWVVSIEVSKDKSVRGVWKDVWREGPGARVRRSASDRRGVKVKEL